MTKLTDRQLKIISLAGILIGLVPVGIFSLWVYVNTQTAGYPENVELFNSYFPEYLRGRWSTTYLSMACCVVSIALCALGARIKSRSWRFSNRFFVILAAILLSLNLWSMM